MHISYLCKGARRHEAVLFLVTKTVNNQKSVDSRIEKYTFVYSDNEINKTVHSSEN